MREIYSDCERGIAWLDPMIGKEVKSKDIYNNPKLAKQERRVGKGMELMNGITQKNPQTLKTIQDEYREVGFRLRESAQYSLRSLFEEPTLWKRLWVMQELSLAPRLTLMCTEGELSWDSLTTLFKDEPYFDAFHMHSSHGSGYYKDFSEVFIPIKLIEDQRRLLRQAGETSSRLMDVLVRFREMESTNPRDKIYGLLGLVTENHGIEVDYTKPVSELYRQTMISLINLSGNLDIICQNPFERKEGPRALQQDDGTQAGRYEIPSWVAEFSAKHCDCVGVIFAQRNIFNAGLKHCETPCRLLGSKNDILALRGTIMGVVGPILEDRSLNNGAEDIMKLYLGENALLHPQKHLYAPDFGDRHLSTGETAIRAFWRTLVKDCTVPPRMRRLRKAEIESLDSANRDLLSQKEINIQSYRIRDTKHYSRSAFSYDPGEGFDFDEADNEVGIAFVGRSWLSYATDDFMFAVTDNGLFMLTRPHAREGDVVVVLDGGKIPMVLRKVDSKRDHEGAGEVYKIVCSTYAHGFMDSEAEIGVSEGWLKKQDILIA